MRKVLTILFVLFIMIIGFGEFVFPNLMMATVRTRVTDRLATDDVQVQMGSDPPILMMLGQLDTIHLTAGAAHIGNVRLREVTLDGKKVFLDLPTIIMSRNVAVRRADSLTLRGVIDADSLKDLLTKKVGRLENVEVSIDEQGIHVTANAKIFGKKADIEMDGVVVDDLGNLYFNMTRLSVRNVHIDKMDFSDMFGNIQMASSDKLPLGMKIQQVKQGDGVITVTAELPKD